MEILRIEEHLYIRTWKYYIMGITALFYITISHLTKHKPKNRKKYKRRTKSKETLKKELYKWLKIQ